MKHYLMLRDEPQVHAEPSGEWRITTEDMDLTVCSRPDVGARTYKQEVDPQLLDMVNRSPSGDVIREIIARTPMMCAKDGNPMPPGLEPVEVERPDFALREYRWTWWVVEW